MDYIGFEEALTRIGDSILPLGPVDCLTMESLGHMAAADAVAEVNAPSSQSSLKDGFAVRSADVRTATEETAVRLTLVGDGAAGGDIAASVRSGTAVRLRTGAIIPDGADAVVASEFAEDGGSWVDILRDASPGRNVLPRGSDVARGDVVVQAGQVLTPGRIGLLAAAGCHRVMVIPKPTVAILATGDEIVAPGQPLAAGQVYASNQATLDAWCRDFQLETHLGIVGDDPAAIAEGLTQAIASADAVVTSGGAWNSDRDHMARVLADLGWDRLFHRVRLGPGKAVGVGMLKGKPVFILPGGPPSNLAAFLLIALPGLLRLAGRSGASFPVTPVTLGAAIAGQSDWTQVVYGTLSNTDEGALFHPSPRKSRLRSMADAEALVLNPEGSECLAAGVTVGARLLVPNDGR